MTAELERLAELAKAATPGARQPWDSIYVGMKAAVVIPGRDPLLTIAEIRTNYADACFIAALDPETILSLLAERKALLEALKELLSG